MLTMTDTAEEAVKAIVSRVPDVADDGGVRIHHAGSDSGFELRVTSVPEPTDTVVASGGARVFLDTEASTALEDRVLDAELAPDGSVRFALGAQA